MSISSMRSKRTSRYREQHQDNEGDENNQNNFNFEEELKESEIMQSYKKALPRHNRQLNLTVNEQLYMLLVERSSELVLCFLDKHDIDKLARGNQKIFILTL